jgi:hypothetical protein
VGTLPSRLEACLPVYHRETGQSSACYVVPVCYLFRYQNCGVLSYWVRFSIPAGSVDEMFDFQAQV